MQDLEPVGHRQRDSSDVLVIVGFLAPLQNTRSCSAFCWHASRKSLTQDVCKNRKSRSRSTKAMRRDAGNQVTVSEEEQAKVCRSEEQQAEKSRPEEEQAEECKKEEDQDEE
ncbi:hypothetical protein GWK47_048189 [Chionoecetes opilio]|uniref:Uncharacterized protein n=1 Tax=Chionoecetes opilio TaxID=41210 RepID=A0A8J4YD15_CHIOP|nr:hypothetical protein GWK47_048189 [Chionoecetes opilio]